jgi:hypothetical protein
LIARGVWCVLSLMSIGMGGFRGRKDSLPGVAPGLETITLSVRVIEIKGRE